MNNEDFWNKYLVDLENEIIKLCNKKNELLIDLHIHSNYSADGNQSLQEIIEEVYRLFDFSSGLLDDIDNITKKYFNEFKVTTHTLIKDKITYKIIVYTLIVPNSWGYVLLTNC